VFVSCGWPRWVGGRTAFRRDASLRPPPPGKLGQTKFHAVFHNELGHSTPISVNLLLPLIVFIWRFGEDSCCQTPFRPPLPSGTVIRGGVLVCPLPGGKLSSPFLPSSGYRAFSPRIATVCPFFFFFLPVFFPVGSQL